MAKHILSFDKESNTTTYLVGPDDTGQLPDAYHIIKRIKATESQAEQVQREIECLKVQGLLLDSSVEDINEERRTGLKRLSLTKHFSIKIKYIPGMNLEEFCTQNPNLSVEKYASLMYHMALVLANFHNHGWVHRDIKPDNFMVTDSGLVLIDFGLSIKVEESSKVLSIGNFAFSAPESRPEDPSKQKNDQQSDIHSFGKAILYILQCFRPNSPFDHSLNFDDIAKQLKALPFNETQQKDILTLTHELCEKKHGERATPDQVCGALKASFANIEGLSWVKEINFSPPHQEVIDKNSPNSALVANSLFSQLASPFSSTLQAIFNR